MIGNLNSIFKQKSKIGASAVVYDTDAQAYFTANTAITSTADKNAINTFYLGLKSDGIYTKIKAMYLPIWGSAAASKWNLKDPRDLDAAFRMTFSVDMTYASNGINGNGVSVFADTKFSTLNYQNSNHLSLYIQTNIDEAKADIGAYESLPGRAFDIESRVTNVSYNLNYVPGVFSTYANTDSRGFYINTRTTATLQKSYKNGTIKATDTTSGVSNFGRNIYICARNEQGVANYYTTKRYSFASIGDGLTDTDASNFNTRVNTLMTYFGINTY